MAKRRKIRRDKYGRFKGKGAIKPFRNNLQGVTRKGAPNRGVRKARRSGRGKREAFKAGVAIAGTAVAVVAISNAHAIHKSISAQRIREMEGRRTEALKFEATKRAMAGGKIQSDIGARLRKSYGR